ncbi:MAG: cytochrome bd-I oxidase subunit CydX [Gammaproteobacteria bacterium]|nr:cytochrome bd-I oxidase subunit CydX [Gammaproteobacteria bacterium]
MWYFTWILGVLLAASLGVINVMWLEHVGMDEDSCTGTPDECGGKRGD